MLTILLKDAFSGEPPKMSKVEPFTPYAKPDHVNPLEQRSAPLGRGLIALPGVSVPLRSLHVSEDVRSGLVQSCNLQQTNIFCLVCSFHLS